MTRPAATQSASAAAWRTLVGNAGLTPTLRTCATTAAHLADLATLPDDPASDPRVGAPARSAAWYRIALAAYTQLRDTGAYRHLEVPRPRIPEPCELEQDKARMWLASTLPGHDQLTVAAGLGIDDGFDVEHGDLMNVVESLLRQAQEAGVFGIPGHRITAYPVADVDIYPDAHVIVLHHPDGPGVASPPIAPDQLIDHGRRGIDAALSILANAADAANDLRRDWIHIAAPHLDARPAPGRPRPFAPMDRTASTPTAASPIGAPAAPVPQPVAARRSR